MSLYTLTCLLVIALVVMTAAYVLNREVRIFNAQMAASTHMTYREGQIMWHAREATMARARVNTHLWATTPWCTKREPGCCLSHTA